MNFINALCVLALLGGVYLTREEAKMENKGAFYEPPVETSVVAKYAAVSQVTGLTSNEEAMLNILAKHMGRKK